jgi:hypothetical protein
MSFYNHLHHCVLFYFAIRSIIILAYCRSFYSVICYYVLLYPLQLSCILTIHFLFILLLSTAFYFAIFYSFISYHVLFNSIPFSPVLFWLILFCLVPLHSVISYYFLLHSVTPYPALFLYVLCCSLCSTISVLFCGFISCIFCPDPRRLSSSVSYSFQAPFGRDLGDVDTFPILTFHGIQKLLKHFKAISALSKTRIFPASCCCEVLGTGMPRFILSHVAT